MPVSANTLRLLIDAGIEGDELVAVVASIDADMMPRHIDEQAERRRAKDRARARVRRQSADNPQTECKKVPPHTPPKKTTTPQNPTGSLPPTAKSELETVLSPEMAKNVIAHRKKIRKPLTDHAAKLLAGKFARCRDPAEAANAMIANGWQGFEPEWMENGKARNGSAADKRADDSRKFREEMAAEYEIMFGTDG